MKKVFPFFCSVLILMLLCSGCLKQNIKDESSVQRPIEIISELTPTMLEIDVYTDAMQRDGEFPAKVIVDTSFYDNTAIERGQLVYIVPDENLNVGSREPFISRIIGLPNETLEIEEGQVVIDQKKLDTFYGHDYYWNPIHAPHAEKRFDYSQEALHIPTDSYYVASDNWWRSGAGFVLAEEYIKGKVIGIKE